ncbi:hypothetical protein ACHWQZ_G003208 [Mnemiopsis leidyi]
MPVLLYGTSTLDSPKRETKKCGSRDEPCPLRVTNSPGGNSTLNIFNSESTEQAHTVSQCQAERNKSSIFGDEEEEEYTRARLPSAAQIERNKSVVFEDQDHKPQRRTSVKQTGPPERQSSLEPSNFYDTNYRPSTKVQNPPGGASSVTFG